MYFHCALLKDVRLEACTELIWTMWRLVVVSFPQNTLVLLTDLGWAALKIWPLQCQLLSHHFQELSLCARSNCLCCVWVLVCVCVCVCVHFYNVDLGIFTWHCDLATEKSFPPNQVHTPKGASKRLSSSWVAGREAPPLPPSCPLPCS